jgi:hypothetical protein
MLFNINQLLEQRYMGVYARARGLSLYFTSDIITVGCGKRTVIA